MICALANSFHSLKILIFDSPRRQRLALIEIVQSFLKM
jgi:hypothetical protein